MFGTVMAQTRAGDEGLRHEVTEVMDSMVAAGLTVLRFWAFCDGEQWNSLQPSPGRAAFHLLSRYVERLLSRSWHLKYFRMKLWLTLTDFMKSLL